MCCLDENGKFLLHKNMELIITKFPSMTNAVRTDQYIEAMALIQMMCQGAM